MRLAEFRRFGIDLIDNLVFNRIENVGAILILGDGGTGKSILCKQFAYEGLLSVACASKTPVLGPVSVRVRPD